MMRTRRSILLVAATIAAATTLSAQRAGGPAPWVLRDVAQPNFYLRTPEFVDTSTATFLNDDDRVLGITGEGVAKAYPRRPSRGTTGSKIASVQCPSS
jgi:hypothetical protein